MNIFTYNLFEITYGGGTLQNYKSYSIIPVRMNPERKITVGSWNADKGGNRTYYTKQEFPPFPLYYPEILKGIDVLKSHGVEAISLIDTYGWPTQISREKLQQDTGYSFATIIPTEDDRFLAGGKDTSITLLTNLPVKSFDIVRLHNRNCGRITAAKGKTDVDIYAVYLDDQREKTRIMQTADLVREISARKRPTIIMGDLNCTSEQDSTKKSRIIQKMFETIPRNLLPYRYVSSVSRRILNRMYILTEKYHNHGPILYLTGEGFTDSSTLDHSETMPTKKMFPVPFIDVDRVLVSGGITFMDTVVLTDYEFNVSDHYPRIANLVIGK